MSGRIEYKYLVPNALLPKLRAEALPHLVPDVPPGGAASFVCVEPAVLSPVTLAPGALWRGTMRLHASRPSDRPT